MATTEKHQRKPQVNLQQGFGAAKCDRRLNELRARYTPGGGRWNRHGFGTETRGFTETAPGFSVDDAQLVMQLVDVTRPYGKVFAQKLAAFADGAH